MSELKFNGTESVGAIVAEYPNAGTFFMKYSIDFCCGGDRPLTEAAAEKGMDPEKVFEELAGFLSGSGTAGEIWSNRPANELISHIISTHHDYLREHLPLISKMTNKVARVHGPGHPELIEIDKLFHQLKDELEEHIDKEENELFPLIVKYDEERSEDTKALAEKGIETLEAEHDEAGRILEKIRELSSGFTLPADACNTYRLTYHSLEELEKDMFQHVHLENNILFKPFSSETLRA
ncbi:iron-sulfur cluster repair di-iron protein [Bacillus marinisedimentorum]|uniref:iron-sulfur cluster repair di-iron protein n=1 Tax=Bacillus marinisedimentorum TaxID=1821260 RepID=UPI0007E0D7DF|nr:iron-sulfur cluster repair di-iron protein [Bacillus marinisedimentorum]